MVAFVLNICTDKFNSKIDNLRLKWYNNEIQGSILRMEELLMNFASFGKLLLGIGTACLLLGGLFLLLSRIGLSKLPGDIVLRRGNFTFFFPIVSSIVLSLLLTLIFYIVNRLR